MIDLRTARAHPSLQAIVSGFTERRAFMPELKMIRPLSSRPDQFLEFYFREPYRVRIGGDPFAPTPSSVLVGITSRPGKDLAYQGEIETFGISFQPTGLARLFGVRMRETVDEGLPLLDVLKRQTVELDASLRGLATFEARVAHAQNWIAAAMDNARAADGVDHAARLLARSGGRADIAAIASRAGLSARQIQRRFLDDVGVTPKAYARICRFNDAVAAKRRAPRATWASIAARSGFTDQAHLTREFGALGGGTPVALATAFARVPERFAGSAMSEIYKPQAAGIAYRGVIRIG